MNRFGQTQYAFKSCQEGHQLRHKAKQRPPVDLNRPRPVQDFLLHDAWNKQGTLSTGRRLFVVGLGGKALEPNSSKVVRSNVELHCNFSDALQ